jgi:hypothetical protein
MKKTNIMLIALASVAMLASCQSTPSTTSDADIANAVAAKSALIISSATSKGLNIGADGVNNLKSPAYLYVATAFSYPDALVDGKKTTVTASVAWSLSSQENVTKAAFDATHEKYTFTYKSITVATTYVFTGTVTYQTATATAIFNVSIAAAA